MNLTQTQIDLLRTRPHEAELYLSIYQPSTVFSAQVNDATITKGARTITYNNSSGDYTKINSGMTLYVGSSAGDWGIGKIRVKSADATTLTVPENSHINWSDGLYLTVVSFYEIWPMFTRLVQSGENVTFYKDYDIAYTDQNSVLGSFVCMGSHHAEFLDGGQAQVYYSATGTYNFKGDSLTYAWEFEGGSPSSGTVVTPGNITYSTPGHYTTKLIVTNASGGTDTSYRHISIYDKFGQGNVNPIKQWVLKSLDGSRSQGGYSGKFEIYAPLPTIPDGALVIIFSKTWYGNTQQNIGSNVLFSGYIEEGSISHDYNKNKITFTASSPTEIMKQASAFSVSVEDKVSPTTWYELKDMDVRRALYHYLKWHSTVLLTNDVQFVGEDYPIQYFDSDRGSLYDAVHTLMKNTLWGNVVSDKTGKIWFETEYEGLLDNSIIDTTFDLRKEDWIGTPKILQRQKPVLSYLELGGIAYSGASTGTFNAYMTSAPGTAPHYYGKVERLHGMALAGQTQLNTLAGNVFASKNAKYPEVTYSLAGAYTNFDIAPQEIITLNMDSTDNPQGIKFEQKKFLLNSMRWQHLPDRKYIYPNIVFREMITGILGDTVSIPDTPPTSTEPSIGGGVTIPPITIPAIPQLVVPTSSARITASVYRSSDQTIASDTFFNEVNFTNASWDTWALWLLASPNQFTIRTDGYYLITFQAKTNAHTTDNTKFNFEILRNYPLSTSIIARLEPLRDDQNKGFIEYSTVIYASIMDTIGVYANNFDTVGTDFTIYNKADGTGYVRSPRFSIIRIA